MKGSRLTALKRQIAPSLASSPAAYINLFEDIAEAPVMPTLADKPNGGSGIPFQERGRYRSSYIALELFLVREQRLAQAESVGHSLRFIEFSGVLKDAGKDFSWKLVQVHAILDSKRLSVVYFVVCSLDMGRGRLGQGQLFVRWMIKGSSGGRLFIYDEARLSTERTAEAYDFIVDEKASCFPMDPVTWSISQSEPTLWRTSTTRTRFERPRFQFVMKDS